MPGEKLPEYNWTVTLTDGTRLHAEAAYIQDGGTGPVHSANAVVLKDGAHKTVLYVPLDALACVQRGTPVQPSGR